MYRTSQGLYRLQGERESERERVSEGEEVTPYKNPDKDQLAKNIFFEFFKNLQFKKLWLNESMTIIPI